MSFRCVSNVGDDNNCGRTYDKSRKSLPWFNSLPALWLPGSSHGYVDGPELEQGTQGSALSLGRGLQQIRSVTSQTPVVG